MIHNDILAKLPDVLLPWYDENKRDLPWRKDKDPYHIWLSEIMLQQTRVEAVRGYYERFLRAVPTISALANADDELLHKLWEGLGYYSRVRNLKKAANVIVEEYNGHFPTTHSAVISLPGIGPYTAGAICSIAYNQKTPAVDGNVLRVISRLTNDASPIDLPATKNKVSDCLTQIYPEKAGDFTQALMELGATVCVPNGEPNCDKCPCRSLCLGYQTGGANKLPIKSPKKERKREDLTVLILQCGDYYALEKRPSTGLLADLWQFPNFPGKASVNAVLEKLEENGLRPKEIMRQVEKKHIFTHVEWSMNGIYVEVSQMENGYFWFTADEINRQVALPTAFRQFWEEIDYV